MMRITITVIDQKYLGRPLQQSLAIVSHRFIQFIYSKYVIRFLKEYPGYKNQINPFKLPFSVLIWMAEKISLLLI